MQVWSSKKKKKKKICWVAQLKMNTPEPFMDKPGLASMICISHFKFNLLLKT